MEYIGIAAQQKTFFHAVLSFGDNNGSDQDQVHMKFEGESHVALPLVFQMSDRVLDYMATNKSRPVRLKPTIVTGGAPFSIASGREVNSFSASCGLFDYLWVVR